MHSIVCSKCSHHLVFEKLPSDEVFNCPECGLYMSVEDIVSEPTESSKNIQISTSAQIQVDVSVSPTIESIDQDALSEIVRDSIADHIKSRGNKMHKGYLRARVTTCQAEHNFAVFTISVDGELNDKTIHRILSAKRRNESHITGGGIIGAVFISALNNLLQSAFDTGNSGKLLSQCCSECLADVALLIDKTVGQEESFSSKSWKLVSIGQWVLAGIAVLTCAIAFALVTGPMGFWYALISPGIILGPCVVFLIHSLGLMVMPTRFFRRDPRGKKALARTGVNSVLAVRIMCFLMAIITAAGALGSFMMAREFVLNRTKKRGNGVTISQLEPTDQNSNGLRNTQRLSSFSIKPSF